MVRTISFPVLICCLAACVSIACPVTARADDGSQPTVIIDDGSTDTSVPVPPGTTDPDNPTGTNAGNPTGGATAPPVDNPNPEPPAKPDNPVATPTPTVTAPPPPSYCEATPTADIGVTAVSGLSQYTAGSMVNYTVDVFNNGPCSAPDATLTFKVPSQLELLSPNQVSVSQGECAVTGGVGSQLITCSFGALEADPNVNHVSVAVSVRADSLGLATAEAGVSTTVSDWNVGDNQRSNPTITVISASPASPAAHQRMSQSRETVRAQGLLWDGRVFRSTDELAGWLIGRGGSWDRFDTNHPEAAAGLKDRG